MKRLTPLLALSSSLAMSSSATATPEATPGYTLDPDTGITLLEGFDAELLYEVPPSQGSWVAMAFDPKGRLIVSDQDDKGVFRVTLPAVDKPDAKVEESERATHPALAPVDRVVGETLEALDG